jgi:DNA-binding transcriptional LysR family regulator
MFAEGAGPPAAPGFRITFNEAEAATLAAANGVGITQTLDLLAARSLKDGQLVTVLPEHALPGPPLSLVHTQAALRLARVRVCATFLRGLLEDMVRRVRTVT